MASREIFDTPTTPNGTTELIYQFPQSGTVLLGLVLLAHGGGEQLVRLRINYQSTTDQLLMNHQSSTNQLLMNYELR